jgi:hypothetical protein
MLSEGRLPLSEAEHAAVDKLIANNPDETVSMTRSEPGETGPLLVHVGDKTWKVATDGKRKKVT